MTDYPYLAICPDGKVLDAGGLELDSNVTLSDLCLGDLKLWITGAFAKEAPKKRVFHLRESRLLKEPVTLFSGPNSLLETGQSKTFEVDLSKMEKSELAEMKSCPSLAININGEETIQTFSLCQ